MNCKDLKNMIESKKRRGVMSMKPLSVGMKRQVEWVVTRDKLAASMKSGSVEVFATPMCVALLEQAAMVLVQEGLEDGMTTVGTSVAIDHIAATPEGMVVRGEAVLTGIEGRVYTFAVTAYDEREKIAEGTHKRIQVFAERFAQKAKAKGL